MDSSTMMQILIPGVLVKYNCQSVHMDYSEWDHDGNLRTFDKLRVLLGIEPLEEMLKSSSVTEIIKHWFNSANDHAKAAGSSISVLPPSISNREESRSIRQRLYQTQGFRALDWPMHSSLEMIDGAGKPSYRVCAKVSSFKVVAEREPHHEANGATMQVEAFHTSNTPSEMLQLAAPTLVTFSAKKSVPLIGGYRDESHMKETNIRPRVAVIPTSYTDLYAELGALLPDCEQTAVCLICGEVLNAGGKGECTRHSYKCGAGTGLFFLLQECSGLIMHKGKAAYIHSPYVDSHGKSLSRE